MFWVWLIIIVFVLISIIGWFSKSNDEVNTKKAYEECLRKLKIDPNNPDLREKALQLGRHYASIKRDYKGSTGFDEIKLMNDINAACARATVGQNGIGKVEVTNPIPLSAKSISLEIEKLGRLYSAGVITAAEFERGKSQFLGVPSDKAAKVIEMLQSLYELKRAGVLSESEFNIKKWEILSTRLIAK